LKYWLVMVFWKGWAWDWESRELERMPPKTP